MLDEKIVRKAIELNKQGRSIYSIAKEFNMERKTLINWLDKMGYNYRRKSLKVKGITKDKLIDMYVYKNMDLKEIGNQFGVCAEIIRRRCDEYNVPSNPTNRAYYLLSQHNIKKMYLEDLMTLGEIAEETKTSHYFVREYLKNIGVEIRTPKEMTGLIIDKGRFVAKHTMLIKYTDRLNRVLKFRSKWEVLVADWLDENKIKWDYEVRKFDLGKSNYLPDFFIYNDDGKLNKIIEVKGWFNQSSIEKAMLFETLYPEIDYEIWDVEVIDFIKKEVA